MKNTLIAASCFIIAGLAACTSSPTRRTVTGTSTGVAGSTTGAAGSTTGAAGNTTGAAGDQGAAGNTTGAAGNTTGAAGDQGAAGSTADAGAAGTGAAGAAGTGAAGDQGMAGAGGAAGAAGATGAAGACTMGATGGAGGGTGSSCAHAMWTFTPSVMCGGTNAACGFCGNAMTGTCAPKNAIDGSLTTRFTDGQAQSGVAENFVLSFASPVSVTGIKLDSSGSPTDATTSYLAEYSLDGTNFLGWCPALAGPGGGATTDIVFPARISVKAIRISQTGVVADGHSWWSIQEVTLDGCQ